MSNDIPPDDKESNPYFSTEETDESSDVDEFLERFEADQSSEPESPEPRPTERDSEEATKRGRLWDSFSSDRSATTSPDQSSTDEMQAVSSGSGSTADDGGDIADEWAFQEPAAEEPQPAQSGDDGSGSDTETDSEEGATSFRSILKRNSHRISGGDETATTDTESDSAADATQPEAADSAGFSASDAVDSSPDFADAASAQTGPTDTAPTTSPTGTGPGTGQGQSRSTSAGSDTIDEILNNIDLFGRATSSSQVLLLSPTAHSITNDIYGRFLLPTDGAGQNILFVSATQSPTDQIDAARKIPGWREGKTAVIEVGQSVLTSARPAGGPDPTRQLDIYKRISNLQHLAKLGINISHIVSQWNGNRRPTVVGVHTLSAIQQYVGNETMFQFLFTLKGQLNSMGVMGFYHMDPAVHTDNEISTIQSAFDLVIRVGSDGSVDIE